MHGSPQKNPPAPKKAKITKGFSDALASFGAYKNNKDLSKLKGQ